MPNIQTPGAYGDDADEVAKRLVEGDVDEATPTDTGPKKEAAPDDESPGPFNMTMGAWKALGPEGQWSKMLESYKVSPEDARKMLRQIIAHGHVTRAYPLWNGAVRVTFRNPPGEHRLRVAREFNRLVEPSTQMVNEVRDRMNFAGCLLSYEDGTNDRKFAFPERGEKNPDKLDELFQARWDFVDTIPPEVQPHLFVVVNHFMGLVSTVLANGAVGSF